MKLTIDGIEIETERNLNEGNDLVIELLAAFINTLTKERKEKLLSLLSKD